MVGSARGRPAYQPEPNDECPGELSSRKRRGYPRSGDHGSETADAKIRGREGNSPDRRLRSRSPGSVGKGVATR